MVGREAECTSASFSASWAVAPADRANAVSAMLTRGVAQACIVLLLWGASQRSASRSTVRVLRTRNADISHAARAVRRADAACHVVVVLTAFRVPERAPLFAVIALVNGASAAAVGVRLVAEGTIIPELIWAVLPAYGTDTVVPITAPRIAQKAVLLLVGRAAGNRNADTAAIGLHPATLSI